MLGQTRVGELFNLTLHIWLQLFVRLQIDFGKNNDERLGLEERLDVVEERYLLLNGVSASL